MEMEPAVDMESESTGEGNEGPRGSALLGVWEAPAPPVLVLVGQLRGLPQNAGCYYYARPMKIYNCTSAATHGRDGP